MLKNSSTQFGLVARVFHWVLAILVSLMLGIGFFMGDIGSPLVYNLHKLTGLFILGWVILMMIWQRANIHPDYPPTMPRWQHVLAKSGQHLMLLCILIMPITGWIFTTVAGHPPVLGNCFINMPGIQALSGLAPLAKSLHKSIDYVLLACIIFHLIGASFHHFYLRDSVVKRMTGKC